MSFILRDTVPLTDRKRELDEEVSANNESKYGTDRYYDSGTDCENQIFMNKPVSGKQMKT